MLNLSRRSVLAGTAAVAIAPLVAKAAPLAPAEIYGASPAMAVLPDVVAWQRAVAAEIERIVRPPLIGDINGTYRQMPFDRSRLDALMAIKPDGA